MKSISVHSLIHKATWRSIKCINITGRFELLFVPYDSDRWCSSDIGHMKEVAKALPGVRVLRQEPVECTIAFICSANNNISRITQMMDSIRRRFGKFLCATQRVPGKEVSVVKTASEVRTPPVVAERKKTENFGKKMTGNGVEGHSLNSDGLMPQDIPFRGSPNKAATNDHEWFAFPGLETLAAASEEEIRTLGLGYRARSVCEGSAYLLNRGGEAFLRSCADLSPEKCQEELCKIRSAAV
eukprot:GHVT01085808.1.p1 GENE.GHVT01085808.1~~GHVT01085808.1.p1  ORF type:complete len:241 (-),score=13.87 GHVT01085808.1:265-987(-)